MGIIKFLDAHCGTILTICIIVVVEGIITHFRLKKVSWEFENERQKFRDKYKPIPIVRLGSPEKDMLCRVFHMCREMATILRHLEEREDWQTAQMSHVQEDEQSRAERISAETQRN